jgi:hypothetical protein
VKIIKKLRYSKCMVLCTERKHIKEAAGREIVALADLETTTTLLPLEGIT